LCGLGPKEKEGRRKDKHVENKERKLEQTTTIKQHCPFMTLQFLYYADCLFTNPVFLLMSFTTKR
jgi:hypothetical protein